MKSEKKISEVPSYLTTIPVIVLGLSVQYYFEETMSHRKNQTTATATATATTTINSGDIHHHHYDSNPDHLQLEPYQKELLHAATLHHPQQEQTSTTTKIFGVWGDLTDRICQNSGIQHCISMGCPSSTISRDLHLGNTLQSKWDTLLINAATSTTSSSSSSTFTATTNNSTKTSNNINNIKIGMAMPASWNKEDERLHMIHLQSYLQ